MRAAVDEANRRAEAAYDAAQQAQQAADTARAEAERVRIRRV